MAKRVTSGKADQLVLATGQFGKVEELLRTAKIMPASQHKGHPYGLL